MTAHIENTDDLSALLGLQRLDSEEMLGVAIYPPSADSDEDSEYFTAWDGESSEVGDLSQPVRSSWLTDVELSLILIPRLAPMNQ